MSPAWQTDTHTISMLSRLASIGPSSSIAANYLKGLAPGISRQQIPQAAQRWGRMPAAQQVTRQLTSKSKATITSRSSAWVPPTLAAMHKRIAARADILARRMSSGPQEGMHIGGRSAVASIIATNVLVYFMWQRVDPRFMMQHFTLSADNLRRHGRWHTLITHVFSHRTLDHLVMNMLGLFFFAPAMTAALGAPAFMGAYAAMGVLSGLATLWGNAFAQRVGPPSMWAQRATVSLGASGAVYGVLAYGVCANPTATIYLNFFIPMPAWLFGAGIVGYSAYRSVNADPLDHIGHTAHLSGAIMGGLLFLVTRGRMHRR